MSERPGDAIPADEQRLARARQELGRRGWRDLEFKRITPEGSFQFSGTRDEIDGTQTKTFDFQLGDPGEPGIIFSVASEEGAAVSGDVQAPDEDDDEGEPATPEAIDARIKELQAKVKSIGEQRTEARDQLITDLKARGVAIDRRSVEGTRGVAWYDAQNDSMWVVRADAAVQEIRKGMAYNFGNRENQAWRKWMGAEGGWTSEVTAREQQQALALRRRTTRTEPRVALASADNSPDRPTEFKYNDVTVRAYADGRYTIIDAAGDAAETPIHLNDEYVFKLDGVNRRLALKNNRPFWEEVRAPDPAPADPDQARREFDALYPHHVLNTPYRFKEIKNDDSSAVEALEVHFFNNRTQTDEPQGLFRDGAVFTTDRGRMLVADLATSGRWVERSAANPPAGASAIPTAATTAAIPAAAAVLAQRASDTAAQVQQVQALDARYAALAQQIESLTASVAQRRDALTQGVAALPPIAPSPSESRAERPHTAVEWAAQGDDWKLREQVLRQVIEDRRRQLASEGRPTNALWLSQDQELNAVERAYAERIANIREHPRGAGVVRAALLLGVGLTGTAMTAAGIMPGIPALSLMSLAWKGVFGAAFATTIGSIGYAKARREGSPRPGMKGWLWTMAAGVGVAAGMWGAETYGSSIIGAIRSKFGI